MNEDNLEKEMYKSPQTIEDALQGLEKINLKYVLIALAICVLVLGVVVTLFLKQSAECADNPFVYGAKEMQKDGIDVMCNCEILAPGYAGFNFDVDGMEVNNIEPGPYQGPVLPDTDEELFRKTGITQPLVVDELS